MNCLGSMDTRDQDAFDVRRLARSGDECQCSMDTPECHRPKIDHVGNDVALKDHGDVDGRNQERATAAVHIGSEYQRPCFGDCRDDTGNANIAIELGIEILDLHRIDDLLAISDRLSNEICDWVCGNVQDDSFRIE